jgi:uncharacterized protein (DUF1501 family)
MSRDDDRYEGKQRAMLRRRDFLKIGLAAGIAGSLVALPWMRRALAQRRPDAPAKRVLIFYFSGGMRSSVAFHAAANTRKYNPWGAIAETPMPTPFTLGKLLDDWLDNTTPVVTPDVAPLPDAAYTLSPMGGWGGMRVPRFREIGNQFSVLGTWNTARGDHYRAATEDPTGSATGLEPGLLTRLGAGVDAAGGIAPPVDNTPDPDGGMPDATVTMTDAGDTDGGDPDGGDPDGGTPPIDPRDQIPSFHVEPGAAFGHSTETTARFTPVPLFGVGGLPGRGNLDDDESRRVGRDWARDDDMRARLDRRRLDARPGWGHGVVEQYVNDRESRRRVGEKLTAGWIDVSQNDMQAHGAVLTDAGTVALTNAMLFELFSLALGPDPMTGGPYMDPSNNEFFRTAMDIALAVRLLQLGSPAVCVEMGGFDTHSGERRDAPARFRFLGRIWATLQFLLSRMPEPGEPGKTMFDRTLVMTMSEFGRDPGSDASGFNNGEGSDHGADPSCYYYAHAMMGGGVQPNRHVGVAPTTTYTPLMADRVDLRRLHSTALWALGLEYDNPDWGYPDAPPVTQLFMP